MKEQVFLEVTQEKYEVDTEGIRKGRHSCCTRSKWQPGRNLTGSHRLDCCTKSDMTTHPSMNLHLRTSRLLRWLRASASCTILQVVQNKPRPYPPGGMRRPTHLTSQILQMPECGSVMKVWACRSSTLSQAPPAGHQAMLQMGEVSALSVQAHRHDNLFGINVSLQ